jgi:hypothetical protein
VQYGVRCHVLSTPDGSDDNRKLYPHAVCSDADAGVPAGRYAWSGLHRALTPASSSRAASGTHIRGDRHSIEFDHRVLLRPDLPRSVRFGPICTRPFCLADCAYQAPPGSNRACSPRLNAQAAPVQSIPPASGLPGAQATPIGHGLIQGPSQAAAYTRRERLFAA